MKLTFKNNVTKKEYEFQVEDVGDSFIFYHFNNFVLEDAMDDGEYDYTLTDIVDEETVVLATGIVQIGNYVAPTTAYTNNNTTNYIQYNG